MDTFVPRTGDLFARDHNDEIYALIVFMERETEDGYLCYAMLMYPSGGLSAPQMVIIVPTDRLLCQDYPLNYAAQLAFVRNVQIRERLS